MLRKGSQGAGALAQVVDRLEERHDVEGHSSFGIHATRDSCQQQNGQSVVGTARHRHDVGPECAGSVALARIRQGPKHAEGATAFFVERRELESVRERRDFGVQRRIDARAPLFSGTRRELRITEQGAHDAPVDSGVLAHVEGRQVKPEDVHTPQGALNESQAGTRATMPQQAVLQEFEVRAKLLGRSVAPFLIATLALEARRHQPEQLTVGHLGVALRYSGKVLWQPLGIVAHALQHGLVHAHTRRGMRQVFVQAPQLLPIAPYGEFEVAREGRANRLGSDIRVAVHVSTDP